MIGFIFSNSLKVGTSSTQASQGALSFTLSLFPNSFITEVIIRKSAHFLEFFITGIVLYLTVKSYVNKLSLNLILPLFIGLLVAVIDETIQYFVPGRSSLLPDVLLDFCGIITAVLICALITYIYRLRKLDKRL